MNEPVDGRRDGGGDELGPSGIIEALSHPDAYPHPVDDEIVVHQTHISVVFLAGDRAYKVKKPLDLGFLDFTTLEKRRRYCEREVRLNRRLAPDVYLGVVPITREDSGRLRVEGEGETVEWTVVMRRLPPEATLASHLERDEVPPGTLGVVARRIAAFHAGAEAGPEVSRFGRFEVVAGNARENFEQAGPQVGETVHPQVFERLEARTESLLAELEDLIERRARDGVPRDTHGDLLAEHVYLFPDRDPPSDLLVIDCIEFNRRFRHADPVADMAFLCMDLDRFGRPDLRDAFADAYFEASSDEEGRALLPFYAGYRAIVRAKVKGFCLFEPEVPADEKERARARSRAHWLLALGELEPPERRPALVLVGGLPGTGKTTLARGLVREAGFELVRSDVVRKELAELEPDEPADAAVGEGIYGAAWTERTYATCLERAVEPLRRGGRVVVDATFRTEAHRGRFLDAARDLGVEARILLCKTDEATVRERLAGRTGDASDADLEVYRAIREKWEEPAGSTGRRTAELEATLPPDEVLAEALEVLRAHGLHA